MEGLILGSKKQIDIKAHEKMTLTTLKTLHGKATELAKVEGKTVWLGDSSVNVAQVLLDLISLVEQMSQTLSTHTHNSPLPTPTGKANFMSYKNEAQGLSIKLEPTVE